MGSSADAYLVYGIDLGSGETRNWDLPDWYHEYGGIETQLNEALGKGHGIEEETYGWEFDSSAIIISASERRAMDFGSERVDLAALVDAEEHGNYYGRIMHAVEALELDLPKGTEPGWFLLANYS